MTLLNPIDDFIYSMTLSAAIDGEISDKKMNHIYYLIESLPIFQSYENKNADTSINTCIELLRADNNPEDLIALIDKSLNRNSKRIAYTLSVEIMMVDQNFTNEKLRLLEIFENIFQIHSLETTAIKHSVKIKYSDLESEIGEI